MAGASKRINTIQAIVSRRGRPDLADPYLGQIRTPTLLIVGGYDTPVIQMNEEAFAKLHLLSAEKGKKIVIVPEATHLFEDLASLTWLRNLQVNGLLGFFYDLGQYKATSTNMIVCYLSLVVEQRFF